MLVEKPAGCDMVAVVVGKVIDSRLNCGPVGSHRLQYGPLEKAKYQFTIGQPDEPVLAQEFEKAVAALVKLQAFIGRTGHPRYLVINEGISTNLRFSSPIFEPWVSSIYAYGYVWLRHSIIQAIRVGTEVHSLDVQPAAGMLSERLLEVDDCYRPADAFVGIRK